MIKTFLFNINEAVDIKKIEGYIHYLGTKGFQGKIEISDRNVPDYNTFNEEYKKLYDVYKSVIGKFSFSIGYIESVKRGLLAKSFKTNDIEQRHLKLQLDLLIEEIARINKKLEEDLRLLKRNKNILIIDSLAGYYQNKKNLGYKNGKTVIEGAKNIQDILDNIREEILLQFYFTFDTEEFKDGEKLVLSNSVWDISYDIGILDKNIKVRLSELQDDYNILNNL